MALNIGTNILYQGRNFLDQRQGNALTLRDLLLWSIPVPDGFEVYCDGKWYVWRESYQSAQTGHFKLRIDNEVENSQIQSEVTTNTENIQHLRDTVYPLEFRYVTGGGVYKVGSQIIPEVTWELWKDGVRIVADSIEVIINGIDDSRGVLSSKEKYIGSRKLPNEATIIYITANYKGQSKTLEVLYNLVPKRYLYLSDTKNPIPNPSEELRSISEWAGASTVEDLGKSPLDTKYSIDCRGNEVEGGYYLHYLIPETYFPGDENFQVFVGGLEMSDITIKTVDDFDDTYPEGYRNYIDICFNHKQNGLLNIEFKEVVYQTY